MTEERWARIKEVFDSASELPTVSRPAYLDEACKDDDGLRREVERLLDEFDKTGTFLNQPVVRLGPSLTAGDAIAGRYEVIRLLGRGGMGEVYEVRDTMLNEAVALKTVRADLSADPDFLRRFQEEIQYSRKVTHPNVCRVFEVGVHKFAESDRSPLWFFTMQLLAGETLEQRIRRGGRLARNEAFPIVVQMAEGLQAAHDAGIIHRDFKSGNVILTKTRAVVTDFGLAALNEHAAATTAARVTAEAKITGTVAYMSPEQMSGQPLTPASDVYSFGIVLFEMATGRLPFEDRHIIQSAMQRASGEIPSVRELAPDIDARWESAIRRCLEIEPARRFRSAADLARLFGGGGVYWSRRRWAAAGAAAAATVAAGGAWWRISRRPYEPKPEALAWYHRGVEAFRNVTYEAARRDLVKAVAVDARYAPAYAYLAAAYSELFLSERATESMLQAVSVAQDQRLGDLDALRVKAFQYVIARDFERAQPLFEQLRTAAPPHEKAAAYVDLAWLAFKREDNPGVIPLSEQALQLDPGFAGAKLRMAVSMDRMQKRDDAQKLYAEAESLFNTASNYEGVIETILQRAIFLARVNRSADAEALVNRAMAMAVSTGDSYHEIRLQLALALAYRNTGETAKSREAAERGVKAAMETRMDVPAAIGLLDLGNAYMLRGEPKAAEDYLRKGLEFASRGRSSYSEARAQSSLGSLYLQFLDRPSEVAQYVEPALKFFRSTGYQREAVQSLLVLGGAQDSLAQFDAAEDTLRDAVRVADQIKDGEQAGLGRLFLASVLEKTGRWPDSLTMRTQALSIFGDMRGGIRAAYTLLARGRLYAQSGQFPEAVADLEQARGRVDKMEGKQNQLRARLALAAAEIAYYKANWAEAARHAHEAANANGGADENAEAARLIGLAATHTGAGEAGLTAFRQGISNGRPFEAAHSKLMLAQALWDSMRTTEAVAYAREAQAFFEPHRVSEALWRCRRIMGDDDAARRSLEELKRLWPEEMVRSYLARPDLQKLIVS
jgi:tetratricopeptide (TPR) repeat protein